MDDVRVIDGVQTTIGVDASGQGNNFQDENFAVGNTSENWVSSFTCDKPMNSSNSLLYAFDGSLDGTHANEQVGSAVYTFIAPVSGDYRIRMYTNGIRPIQVDGSTVVTVGTGTLPQWYTIGSVTAGQSIVVNGAGQAGGSFIYAYNVDGELLIQPNIQDTVLDTPMKSYATFNPGSSVSNGNLRLDASGSSIYGASNLSIPSSDTGLYLVELSVLSGRPMLGLAPAGTDPTSTGYYFAYELTPGNIYGCTFDPANDTARLYENGAEKEVNTNINFDAMFASSPFSGQSASVFINFGQQPFAYPVAGYEGLYQTWSEWVIQTLRSGLAEADALRSVLISHAMTYDAARRLLRR